MADKDYTRAEVIQIVADAARSHGIPKDDFLRASYIETGGKFNERAYNEGSHAAGLFQFLPSTASAYGIRGREFDPRVSSDAAARFYQDNERSITRSHTQTGRPYLSCAASPNGLDMYIAHQQGAGGYSSIQAAVATGQFSRSDTRVNILSNISPRDAQTVTGHSLTELRAMSDGDLARNFVGYWSNKYDRIAIPEQNIVPRNGLAAAAGEPVHPVVLRRGSEGEAVVRLQQQLIGQGIAQENGQPLKVDGKFGPATEAAVKQFQARMGLAVDGVAGRDTHGALNDPALRDGVLRKGESGVAVERLQQRLIDAGITQVQGKPLAVDGKFGPQTLAAVEAYQRQHGLAVDGVAGPRTMSALDGRSQAATNDLRGHIDSRGESANWPAPGNHTINQADKPREGHGEFGTPRNNRSGRHSGVDIQGDVGDPIKTYGPGRVVFAGRQADGGGYGNYVVIEHPNRIQTVYAHLDSVSVRDGDPVRANQTIGTMGRSGNTPARGDTHLHFELRENATPGVKLSGSPVDPMPYLRAAARNPSAEVGGAATDATTVLPGLLAQQNQVASAISDRLAQHGYNATQIDAITAATAAANARDGELHSPGTRFYVGRDGQRVAAQYVSGMLREVDIAAALQQDGHQHLQAAAQSLGQRTDGDRLPDRDNDAGLMTTGESHRVMA